MYNIKNKQYFSRLRHDLLNLIPLEKRDGKLLEIGAGSRDTLIYAKENDYAKEVVGIELNKLENFNQNSNKIDKFIIGDIEKLNLKEIGNNFDIIICGDVLEHLVNPYEVVKKLKNILKSSGILIAIIPNFCHYSVKEYQKKDKRIKLYINENLGFSKNFEKAISLCKGDYIALSDQDDIWELDKIETMVKNINDAILVYGDEKLIDENDNIIADSFFQITGYISENDNYKKFFCSNYISGHNMMFKKELISKIIPVPEQLFYHDMWIALLASKNGKIKYINKILSYYRQHAKNISKSQKTKRNIFQKIFNPVDWNTYVLWNKDRIKRIKVFKKYFPEDKKFLNDLENYYSHKKRIKAFLFALRNINIIIIQKGFLRKLKYIMLPLFAPKACDE